MGNVKGLGKEDGFSALLPPLLPLLLPMVPLLLLLFMVIAAFVAIWLFATPSQTAGRRSPPLSSLSSLLVLSLLRSGCRCVKGSKRGRSFFPFTPLSTFSLALQQRLPGLTFLRWSQP